MEMSESDVALAGRSHGRGAERSFILRLVGMGDEMMAEANGKAEQSHKPIDPSAATQQYLNKQISLSRYVQMLDAYVPSSETLLRSLDEHPTYVDQLAKSLERSDSAESTPQNDRADG
jgi:hypothetical protein